MRRVVVVLTGLLIGGLSTPDTAHALSWDSLWKRSDQQQTEAIDAYHNDDFQTALEGFSLDKTATGAFNRGNTLARSEQLEAALEAYDEALSLQPDFEDAKYNRKLVEDALAQQQQQENENEQEQELSEDDQSADAEQKPDESKEGENSQEQTQSDQDTPAQGESESEQQSDSEEEENAQAGEDKQSAEQNEQASSAEHSQEEQATQQSQASGEEQPGESNAARVTEGPMDEDAQALELLLRQVPDDPGALLRRKFKYQYQNQQP